MALSAPQRFRNSKSTAVRQMIIQCPSCHTKFAIDASTIDQITDPRFHCSRCDNVFAFEETTPSLRPVSTSPQGPRQLELSPQAAKQSSALLAAGSPALSSSALSSSALSSSALSSSAPSRGIQIPSKLDRNMPLNAPHEGVEAPPPPDYQDFSDEYSSASLEQAALDRSAQPVEMPLLDSDTGAEPDYDREFSDSQSQYAEQPQAHEGLGVNDTAELPAGSIKPIMPGSRARFADETHSDFPTTAQQIPEPVPSSALPFLSGFETEFSDQDSALSAENSALPAALRPLTGGASLAAETFARASRSLSSKSFLSRFGEASGMKALGVICTPIAVFLFSLACVAAFVHLSPSTSFPLLRTIFPAAPQMAPHELFLRSAKLRQITLEGGDRVMVVAGKISNDTAQSFRDVIVEAILFDGVGTPLLRTKTSIGSALGKGKIRSLTPELIEKAQHAGGGETPLLAGDQRDFAVVLNDGQPSEALEKARYYSARIYSVQY